MKAEKETAAIRRTMFLGMAIWTVVVGLSLFWNLHSENNQTRALATNEARIHFDKDTAFRFWATRHGGVYVPVDDRTPPNPNLAHIPERDIVTPSGLELTLMNPAYMMRQIMTDFSELYGVRGRITSLKPLSALNTPDEWEKRALTLFEQGLGEIFEESSIDGRPHLRLMRPLVTQEGCLKCHAHQGYKVGDVRGGIGVAVPLDRYIAVREKAALVQGVSHGGIWLLGLGFMAVAGHRARRRTQVMVESSERIRRLSRQNELLLNSAGEGICGMDAEGRTTFINQAAVQMLGWTPEELLGREQHQVFHHSRPDGSDYPIGECPIHATLVDGRQRSRADEVFWRKDGTSFPVEYISSPVSENGDVSGAVVVFRDISAQKEAEAALAERTDELQRSNAELQQFAYVASHDMQEPLRMVTSYLQLLEKRMAAKLEPDEREFMDFAVDGAKRMQRMIRDLLDYSRVGTRGGEPLPVDASDALEEALANLHASINEAGALVTCGEMPMVMADAPQLSRLFQNLIGNAVKYCDPDRKPEIGIMAERSDGKWRFTVKDNGIGIEEKDLDRVFMVFQRLHSRAEYEGTGIGLAICKKIVERHGGRIWMNSRPGQGTEVHFTLDPVRD